MRWYMYFTDKEIDLYEGCRLQYSVVVKQYRYDHAHIMNVLFRIILQKLCIRISALLHVIWNNLSPLCITLIFKNKDQFTYCLNKSIYTCIYTRTAPLHQILSLIDNTFLLSKSTTLTLF